MTTIGPAAGPLSTTLGFIQVLRGAAAAAVVIVHSVRALTLFPPEGTRLAPPVLFSPALFQTVGGAGVDIFFVISGFVMIYVSRGYATGFKSAGDFMVRRVMRIYPMYFLATAGLCAIYVYYVTIKGSGPIFDLQPMRLATSFLFIPSFNDQGSVAPIISVGWTLIYEMYFYICFALALAFARSAIIVLVLAAVTGVIALARLIGGDDAVSLFFQNTIALEFVFGCALGALFVSGRFPQWHPAFLLVPGILAFLVMWDFPDENLRFLIWGIPATLIVAGVLCIEARGGRALSRPWLVFGDASYVIYLFHMIVIYNVGARLVLKIPVAFESGLVTDALIVVFVAACISAGTVIHLLVETPVRRWLKTWYAGMRAPAAAPSANSV